MFCHCWYLFFSFKASKLEYQQSESFQLGDFCPRSAVANLEDASDPTRVVEPQGHVNGHGKLGKAEENAAAGKVERIDDQISAKRSNPNR